MVVVYFQSHVGMYSQRVAIFDDEDSYMECLPALKTLASECGMFVTESVIDKDINELNID